MTNQHLLFEPYLPFEDVVEPRDLVEQPIVAAELLRILDDAGDELTDLWRF